VREVEERAAFDAVETATRQELAKSATAQHEAFHSARVAEREEQVRAEDALEAERVKRLAAEAEAAAQALEARRAREKEEWDSLDKAREDEAAKLKQAAELTERRQQRFERERRLQGRAGCAGLLQVLRHAYGDEAEACSPEVFDASMRFVEAKRVRHVKEILKFNMKAQLVAMLPNMDDEKAARLGDALSTQALVSYEVGPPLSPSGFTSPSARSSPTKSPEAAAKS